MFTTKPQRAQSDRTAHRKGPKSAKGKRSEGTEPIVELALTDPICLRGWIFSWVWSTSWLIRSPQWRGSAAEDRSGTAGG
jgi:hypothetical protein